MAEVLASGGEQIPDTVRDAVLARAARLSSAARSLLEIVAVVPGTVELGLLEDLAGERFAQLDECLACGMLGEGAGASRVQARALATGRRGGDQAGTPARARTELRWRR